MKYIAPEYRNETASSEDIMVYSPNDRHVSTESFDFGNGTEEVSKATSHVGVEDLLF